MQRWFLVIVSLLAVLLCLPVCLQPIRGDAAVFTYAAERMLEGGTLYVDAWDVKPPGIFFQYAAELFLGRSYYAIYFFDLLWAIAAGWMLRRAISRINETAGLLAGVSLVFAYVAMMFAGHMLQPETPALFFMAWLLDIALRDESPTIRDGIAAGIALAALFWLKMPFILVGILVLPRLLRSGRSSFAPVGLSLLSFALTGGLVVMYFAMKRAMPEFVEGSFSIPAKATEVYAFPFAERANRMLPGIIEFAKPIWMLALLAVCGAITIMMKWKREYLPIALLFVATLFIVFFQGRFLYYHWDIVALPFAAMAGFGSAAIAEYLAPYLKSASLRLAVITIALLVPAFADLSSYWQKFINAKGNLVAFWRELPSYYYTQTEVVNLADVLALQQKLGEATSEGDTIFPFSLDPSFNIYSGRLSPTRFSYLWPLTEPRMEKSEWRDELANDLIQKRPKYIVLSRINARNRGDDLNNLLAWPGLREWFQQNYELTDIVGPLQTYKLR